MTQVKDSGLITSAQIGVPNFKLDAPQPFDEDPLTPDPRPPLEKEGDQLSDRKTGYFYTTTYNKDALATQEILFSETDVGGRHSGGLSKLNKIYSDTSMNGTEVDYKQTSLARTRRNLHRKILHNYSSDMRLLTLTYATAVHSRKRVYDDIEAMCLRWKNAHGEALDYISVLELHPGGHGYHAHLVVRLPWFDYTAFRITIWGKGRIKVSRKREGSTRDTASRLSGYLLKYIGKDFDSFTPGQRRYSCGGSWDTDWKTESGFMNSPFVVFHKVLDYMVANRIAHRETIIRPYEDCTIYKISWDCGAHPDLDLKTLYEMQHGNEDTPSKDYGPFHIPDIHGANILDI